MGVRLILHSMRKYSRKIACSMVIKLLGTVTELMIPYILAHLIDDVVPLGRMELVILWGSLMVLTALLTRQLNVCANRIAIDNAHNVSYDIRQALFTKTANLSGSQFDAFGLPSLISRMTSDSYNIQSCVQALQTLCVRMPMMLLGGIAVTLAMDPVLSKHSVRHRAGAHRGDSGRIPIRHTALPPGSGAAGRGCAHHARGYRRHSRGQGAFQDGVRKEPLRPQQRRMTRADIKASTIMAIPGPLMQMCLNIGLTLVVFVGAMRVNSGQIKPGVILAFLTYFNMVMQGVLGINRIFMMISKATASASRCPRCFRWSRISAFCL